MNYGDKKRKSQELASYLKAMGAERTTGQCPWGCGRPIPNGGERLLAHLTTCTGSPKKDSRRR